MANLKPVWVNWWPDMADLRTDLRPEGADFRSGGQCKPGRVEMPKSAPGCTVASHVGPQSVHFKSYALIALS